MEQLNYLAGWCRRNQLAVILLFVGTLAFAGVYYDKINVDNLQLDGNTISSTNTNGDITLDPNGSGGVAFNDLTATTVPYLDANKELTSSAVTPTELGYLSSVTSAIQTQLDAKIDDFSGSTDNLIVRTDGASGNAIQESGVSIDDSDVVSGITQLNVDNLRSDGNTISSTDTNGDINLTPNGSGEVDVSSIINILTQKELRFQDTSGGEYLGFRAPSTVTSSTTFTLPDGDGSNGQFLSTNGSATLAWTSATPTLASATKTSAYTVTTSDNILFGDSSGGAFTFTMMTEASGSGRVFEFLKTSSDVTAITINNDAAGEITTINTEGERVKIYTDGTSWYVLDRYIPSKMVAYTPTFTGFGTATNINVYSRRIGDSLYINGKFTTGTTTATEARITIGQNGNNGGITIDSTKNASIRKVGTWAAGTATATAVKTTLAEAGVSYLTFGFNVSTTAGLTKQNGNGAFASSTDYSFHALVPITGWKE